MARILVIESDTSNQKITRFILEDLGHFVAPIGTETLARKTLDIMPIDLVICGAAFGKLAADLAAQGRKIIQIGIFETDRVPGTRFVLISDWDEKHIRNVVHEELKRR